MEFFFYHRERLGSLPLRMELLEAHWSYMDGFAAEMIARGPTLSEADRWDAVPGARPRPPAGR